MSAALDVREEHYVQIGLQQRLFTQAQVDELKRGAPSRANGSEAGGGGKRGTSADAGRAQSIGSEAGGGGKRGTSADAGRAQSIGDLLVERGVLTKEQHKGLDRAVTYRLGRDEDKRVAQIIVDSGYCSEDRVEAAMRRQKDFYGKTGELMRLGALLIEGGDITDSQHLAAAKIYRIERGS